MKTTRFYSNALTGILSLAVMIGVASASTAHAECAVLAPGSVKVVSNQTSGWLFVQFTAGMFNAGGLLSVDIANNDAVKNRMLTMANAAFLSGSAVYVCRQAGQPTDPWGYTDRVTEIRLIK